MLLLGHFQAGQVLIELDQLLPFLLVLKVLGQSLGGKAAAVTTDHRRFQTLHGLADHRIVRRPIKQLIVDVHRFLVLPEPVPVDIGHSKLDR